MLKLKSTMKKRCISDKSAKSRGLLGNVGYVGAWGAWVKFLRGLRGLRRSNIFYVGHNFYVGFVSQICFCVCQTFYVGPKFFAWVFPWVQQFLLRSILGGESKKHINCRFHNNVLVAH